MRPLSLKVDSKRLPVTTQGEYLQYAESVRNRANGYITKESHDSAKLTNGSGILKVMSQNGKVTKNTNFSKDQWDEISDMHMRDILVIGPEKLRVIRGDIQTSAKVLCRCKSVKKCKEESEENRSDEKARGSGYQHRVVSSNSDV